MREMRNEIWSSIRRNKLRTFLTGFSVAWGILMLIILLSSGNGLQNGIMSNLDYMAKNSMELYSNSTTIPYGGYGEGRPIRFSVDDMKMLEEEFPNINNITTSMWYAGGKLTYRDLYINIYITGVAPGYSRVYKTEVLEGRFINEQDLRDNRKSMVINEQVRDVLFPGESPIGKQVMNSGVVWTVVGVYKGFSYSNSNVCYVAYTTGNSIYASGKPYLWQIMFTVDGIKTDAEMDSFESRLTHRMAKEHGYSPDDKSAVYVSNNLEQTKGMALVFRGIDIFIWVIGIGTLLAGIVGVGNIMLVTVRERTFEFGIRKALGARPSSIIRLILVESVLITSFFGYVGLVLGVGIMEIVNHVLEKSAAEATDTFVMFQNPTLDIQSAVAATIVLIVAGVIAGYVPALKAARLKTIDAMRHNK